MCVQIALLYWELRETPGGKVTARPRSALPSSCSWPRLFGRWWTKVTKIVLNLVPALWCSELCSCHRFLTDHFRPRRSLVFASWSAGEYGNIGATEWLEASTEKLSVHGQRNCCLKKKNNNILLLCLFSELHVLSRQECFHIHQPGRSSDG